MSTDPNYTNQPAADAGAESVARATEILQSADDDADAGLAQGLARRVEWMKLGARLEALGEADLARELFGRVKEWARGEGEKILAGALADARDILKLSRRVAQLGEAEKEEAQKRVYRELARKLHDKAKATAIEAARDILKGAEKTPGEILKLAKALGDLDEFSLGVRILDEARAHRDFGRARADGDPAKVERERISIIQKRALFTYKDVNRPLGTRLDEALEFLEQHANLPTTVDHETLGLAGSIHKRKWDLDKRETHLRRSLDYYRRGYKQGPQGDQGYTSINAAYVLDLLAYLNASEPETAKNYRDEARQIRGEIAEKVPPLVEPPLADKLKTAWLADEWFFYSTVGEAHLGLGAFESALEWLVRRPQEMAVRPPDWEFESTARQLANLVRVQNSPAADFSKGEAWRAFEQFLRDSPMGETSDVSAAAVRRSFEGKAGLALSGGGFRASLFHIGVLARLAELDLLRHVEVISCVSGGSIVGAHYYLEVRRLLQEKPDGQVTKEDYVEIVRKVERDFLAGVQTNIRTRVITDSRAVRRMLRKDYSRTARLGELYEEQLYSRVADEVGTQFSASGRLGKRHMHELTIHPRRQDGEVWKDFKPRNHNWRRVAKAPILILNAATLNTGHNWQFTATYMGEAPATIHREVDSVYRLRRKYYTEGPHSEAEPQFVRLGAAVAASSCVPVLFEPLAFDDMYDGPDGARVSVKLVDGGVCDNQGVAGLLEQDCTSLLVSDGSGQIDPLHRPSAKALSVAMRSNGILQARVRGTQYRELDARLSAAMLGGLMFVHLKKDLDNNPINWAGCPPESQIAPLDSRRVLTSYGVSKDVQRRLAALRTDLDSFSDREAYALMASAYLMTEHEHRQRLADPGAEPVPRGDWKFLRLADELKDGRAETRLNQVLDAGGGLFFKMWKLDPQLKARARQLGLLLGGAAGLVALVALAALVALVLAAWSFLAGGGAGFISPRLLTWVGVLVVGVLLSLVALGLIALLVYFVKLRGVPQWGDSLAHAAVGGLLLVVGCPAARHHMRNYEQRYLDWGKLEG
jgi:predicted acylesterase/phospholipase RssA